MTERQPPGVLNPKTELIRSPGLPLGKTPLGGLDRVRALLLGVALAAAGGLAPLALDPPAALPATAPAGEFSAERAFLHVRSIARAPHPLGSAENAAVRRYLSDQLRALGLAVEVQSFAWGQAEPNGFNVMARIPGARAAAQPARAVALVCHYDSVPSGPGAGDDASGVAALLETARALKAGPALQNDIILLFTDGEEAPNALPGGEAFANRCPWMKDIGRAFNFDARGVSGPVLMYETSAGNGPLIREFARATPRPVANSLMAEVYQHMPNDTDFTTLKRAGLPGLNFGFIGDPQHYHEPTDVPARLSLRSLQHEGSYALSLARHFGNLDLAGLRGADAVYFDFLGRVLIRYPSAWAIPLALLAAMLFIGAAWIKIRQTEASPWKLAGACLASGLNLLLVGALFGYGPGLATRLAHGVPGWLSRLQVWPYWFVALGLTLTLSATLHLALRRWLGPMNLMLGALFWWLLLALAAAFWIPGGSFLGLWPLLFGLLGVLPVWRNPKEPWRHHLWLALTAMPILLLLAPLLREAYVALGPPAVFLPMLFLVLVLGALTLQLEAVSRAWRWALPLAGLLIAVAASLSPSL